MCSHPADSGPTRRRVLTHDPAGQELDGGVHLVGLAVGEDGLDDVEGRRVGQEGPEGAGDEHHIAPHDEEAWQRSERPQNVGVGPARLRQHRAQLREAQRQTQVDEAACKTEAQSSGAVGKEEVDVLGFPSLTVCTVSVDVKQH